MSSVMDQMKAYYKYIVALVLAIVFGGVGYYMYQQMKSENRASTQADGDGASSGGDAELIFFFANWCPHCKKAKPHWEEIKSKYNDKVVNGYTMIFTDVDCSTESPAVKEKTAQYEIEGYPTIKLVKDGQVIEFDAKPTKDTLTKFINTVV